MTAGRDELIRRSLDFPFLFLWRHHIELMIKALIAAAQDLLGRERDVPFGHRLDTLWRDLRPLLQEISLEEEETMNATEACILQLSRVDPDSMAFRYSKDKLSNWTMPAAIDRIDLEHFHTVLSGVANSLSGAYDQIDAYQQSMPREY